MTELIHQDCFLGASTSDLSKFPLLQCDRLFIGIVMMSGEIGFPPGTTYGLEDTWEFPAREPLDLRVDRDQHYYIKVSGPYVGKSLRVRYGHYRDAPVVTSPDGTDWLSLNRPINIEVLNIYRPLIEACLEYGKQAYRERGSEVYDVSNYSWHDLVQPGTNYVPSWEVLCFLDASCYYGSGYIRVLMLYYLNIENFSLYRLACDIIHQRGESEYHRQLMEKAIASQRRQTDVIL